MQRNNEQYMSQASNFTKNSKGGYFYQRQVPTPQVQSQSQAQSQPQIQSQPQAQSQPQIQSQPQAQPNFERKMMVQETPPSQITPPPSPVQINPAYLQGYLGTQIGKYMRINFLLGTGTYIDKEGILEEVGIDHVVIRDIKTNDKVIADLYSIKFVEIPEE